MHCGLATPQVKVTSPQPNQVVQHLKETIMLADRTHHHNGANGHLLDCPSDYPAIDVTPMPTAPTPKPGWRDQHAAFTHHIQWVDADGISHGLTLRSDSLQGLMADLKMVKGMIRQAKQKASESTPQQAETPVPDSDIPACRIHNVAMERRTSKRTGGIYFSHRLPGSKELCFGRESKR
jgi:hypothetical protein